MERESRGPSQGRASQGIGFHDEEARAGVHGVAAHRKGGALFRSQGSPGAKEA